jgi:hypothetical protein
MDCYVKWVEDTYGADSVAAASVYDDWLAHVGIMSSGHGIVVGAVYDTDRHPPGLYCPECGTEIWPPTCIECGNMIYARSTGDTRGVTETLYRTESGGLLVYTEHWSRWQGETCSSTLVRVTPADLDVGGRYELLGQAAGMARPLTID